MLDLLWSSILAGLASGDKPAPVAETLRSIEQQQQSLVAAEKEREMEKV